MPAPAWKNKILIENVFYMMAYAFKAVRMDMFKNVDAEKFDHAEDLLAAILALGIAKLTKQGRYREYVVQEEELRTMRGRLLVHEAVNCKAAKRQVLPCQFDEYSVDNLYNQILLSTIRVLIRSREVDCERIASLRRLLPAFAPVSAVEPRAIDWSRLSYQRSNQEYVVLMNLCRLILDGYLMGDKDKSGRIKLRLFEEDKLSDIFEGFLREYFTLHHPEIDVPGKKQLLWDASPADQQKLPKMETDVMLKSRNKVMIIDAKFYGEILSHRFGGTSYHGNNIYQINTYLLSAKADPRYNTGIVEGMLLYAQTTENVSPDQFMVGRNQIFIRTLDLNKKFATIAQSLDTLVDAWK